MLLPAKTLDRELRGNHSRRTSLIIPITVFVLRDGPSRWHRPVDRSRSRYGVLTLVEPRVYIAIGDNRPAEHVGKCFTNRSLRSRHSQDRLHGLADGLGMIGD